MKLLCFAHRNEAKTFFERLKLSPLDASLKLFKSDNAFVLITGEGIQNTTESLSITLSRFNQINEILNYGVSASLNDTVQKNIIFSIRCAYQYFDDFSFKSFTSNDQQATTDLVSVHKRIYSPEDKMNLSIYANLLDMEAWAIGSVAKRFKKPWYCYKLISDSLHEYTQCEKIKGESESYSQRFWNHFENIVGHHEESLEVTNLISRDPDFHFTFSQLHLLDKYLQALNNRQAGFTQEFMSSKHFLAIKNQEIIKKEKTKKLLDLLYEKYDPITSREISRTKNAFNSLKALNLNFDHSEFIEKDLVKFKGQFQNNGEIQAIINSLSAIDLESIKDKIRDV